MKFKLIGAVSAAVALLTSAAFAEDYPSKTIEVVTHAGNGGGTDVTTRMMMLRARRALKQDMVIVNKKGGGGAAALEYYKTVAAGYQWSKLENGTWIIDESGEKKNDEGSASKAGSHSTTAGTPIVSLIGP